MEFVKEIEITLVIRTIRTLFIGIYTYYIAFKISDSLKGAKKLPIIIYAIIVTGLTQIIKYYAEDFYSILFMILSLSIGLSKIAKKNIEYSIVIITISLSINYICYVCATILNFIPAIIIKIKNEYLIFSVIVIIYTVLVRLFCEIKTLRKGFTFLKEKLNDEYFSVMIFSISIPIIIFIINLTNYKFGITWKSFIGLNIFTFVMFIVIQRSLQLYYKQKVLVQELEETKKELEDKKKEIKELEEENLSISKTNHSIAHKQKSLEHKLDELLLKNEIANEIDIRNRLNEVTKDIQNKETVVKLPETGIEKIDDMLKCMQTECMNNKIDFQVKVTGNIHHMTNHYISIDKLEILLADHIKNAIIAINHSSNTNKSIMVRLGKIDDVYSLYIYDTGIEFEKETLANLGKRPSTTHKDEGGTGMGFMNTFDTLNKYKASLIIKEIGKPSEDNFTKVLIIKFDNKNEFIIE